MEIFFIPLEGKYAQRPSIFVSPQLKKVMKIYSPAWFDPEIQISIQMD